MAAFGNDDDEYWERANGGPVDTRRVRPDGPMTAALGGRWASPLGHWRESPERRIAEARADVAVMQSEAQYLQTLTSEGRAPPEIQLAAEARLRELADLILVELRYIRLLLRSLPVPESDIEG